MVLGFPGWLPQPATVQPPLGRLVPDSVHPAGIDGGMSALAPFVNLAGAVGPGLGALLLSGADFSLQGGAFACSPLGQRLIDGFAGSGVGAAATSAGISGSDRAWQQEAQP